MAVVNLRRCLSMFLFFLKPFCEFLSTLCFSVKLDIILAITEVYILKIALARTMGL